VENSGSEATEEAAEVKAAKVAPAADWTHEHTTNVSSVAMVGIRVYLNDVPWLRRGRQSQFLGLFQCSFEQKRAADGATDAHHSYEDGP
jgi:hypothetical protein